MSNSISDMKFHSLQRILKTYSLYIVLIIFGIVVLCMRHRVQPLILNHYNTIFNRSLVNNWYHRKETFDSQSKPKILILTYMRSGSTLTSGILRQGGNLFYSMEPLWGVYRKCYRRRDDICCRNGTCRNPIGTEESVEETLGVLKQIFNCRFQTLSENVITAFSFFKTNSGYKKIQESGCFYIDGRDRSSQNEMCRSYLSSLCRNSTGVIIKTLRLDAELLPDLARMVSGLKIVHLFRDPRPVLSSRGRLGEFNDTRKELSENAKKLCHRISTDIDVLESNNLATLPTSYECLVSSPHSVVKKMFRILNLNYTEKTKNWIETYMNSNVTELGGFGFQSKNASFIANSWRNDMQIEQVNIIDNLCKHIYQRTGYVELTDDNDLKDLRVPSYRPSTYTEFLCKFD